MDSERVNSRWGESSTTSSASREGASRQGDVAAARAGAGWGKRIRDTSGTRAAARPWRPSNWSSRRAAEEVEIMRKNHKAIAGADAPVDWT